MNYSGKFSKKELAEKLTRIAKRAGAKLVYAALDIFYYTLQSDKVSKSGETIIIGALGYMISPLDVISDAGLIARTDRRPRRAALCAGRRCGRASILKSWILPKDACLNGLMRDEIAEIGDLFSEGGIV